MSFTNAYATRAAIANLPGKTVKPWRTGDTRCHCSHCDLCHDCFPTERLSAHQAECQGALMAVLRRDWSVRVLDFAKRNGFQITESLSKFGPEGEIAANGGAFALVAVAPVNAGARHFKADTDEPQVSQDDARLAAARAVYEMLAGDDQAFLGVCP